MHHLQIDSLASAPLPLRGIDARVKLVAALGFVAAVAAVPAGPRLLAFLGILLVAAGVARLPLAFLGRRLLVVVPFAVLPALFIPFTTGHGAGFGVHGATREGLVAAGVVVGRALLCATAILLLAATTPMSQILKALGSLRVPAVLVSVIGLVYRYVFVLVDELERMARARRQRGGRRLGGLRAGVSLLGTLLVRATERAHAVHLAMRARGLGGAARPSIDRRLQGDDAVFLLVAGLLVGAAVLWGWWP